MQDLSDQTDVGAGWICLSSLSGAETRRDPGSESLARLLVLSLVYPSLAGGGEAGRSGVLRLVWALPWLWSAVNIRGLGGGPLGKVSLVSREVG